MGTPASSRGGGRSKPGGNKSKPPSKSKTSKPPERQVKDVKGSIQPPPQYSKTTGKLTEYGKQQQKLDATAVRDGNQNQTPSNQTENPYDFWQDASKKLAAASDLVGQYNESRETDYSGVVRTGGIQTAAAKQYTTVGEQSKEVQDKIKRLNQLSA